MAAFGAAKSLLNTLRQLLEAPNYPYQQHITNLCDGIDYLRYFLLENLEVKREFEIQIRDAIYEAQDIVDSHLWSTHDFLSPSEAEISSHSFCGELERLIQKVNLIGDMAKSEKFTHQTLERKISESILRNPDEVKALNQDHDIVGRHDDFVQLQDRLTKGSPGLEVVPIVGIAGMGKTTLAVCVFINKEIGKHFGINAWAKVPIEYQKRHVLLDLLQSMKKVGDGIHQMTDDQLAKLLYNSIKRKRYLVLLDNIREIEVWNDLKELFPDYHDGSRILLTTRNGDIARIAGTPHLLDRVSDQHSMLLLCEIVFGRQEKFSSDFFVIMKAIAESCRGHPHAVKIVGRLLRCAKRIPEYWEMVSSSIINACDNYGNLIETLLSLTYKHLPQLLKVCILYMAMFPYDYNVYILTLVDLWIAEGFIPLHNFISSSKEDMEFAIVCFRRLYNRDFISYISAAEREKEAIKISEEVFHDFLMRTAKEEKFFLAINKDTSFGDSLQQEYNTYNQQHRLFIRKNIVPFVNQINSSNTSISNARSLLYYGPEPQYPLSAWFDFELLRVLDILKVRFYSFPPEIPNSIQLRYLALSYNGKLPAAMCRLRNLQFLIVIRCLSVKSSGAPSYLPLDIWNMKTLWKLEVMGSDLPEPPLDTDLKLENLLTLSGVSSHSCTRAILERIPNLYDFGIQIESLVEDECLSFFSHLHILNKLYGFRCVVMYPNIGSPVGPCFIPSFPSTLVDLTLSGCGFPWEYMSVIAALPNLEKLNLQNYAIQGPKWEVKKDEFPNLFYLLLEDMDLKNWILADQSCFPKMRYLFIRHFYKLQEVPYAIGDIPTLKRLEVVDCSTSAMNSALKIEEEKHSQGKDSVRFVLYSSRDD